MRYAGGFTDNNPLGALPLCRPMPYRHGPEPRIRQLPPDKLRALRDVIERKRREGEKLTWGESWAARTPVEDGGVL